MAPKVLLSRLFEKLIFQYRSVDRAVSNVEGLKLKITARKTVKNKFDQIRASMKFIYYQNTYVIGYSVFWQTNMQRLTAN